MGDGLTGEAEAMYFSNMRKNMQSDTAHACIENSQDLKVNNIIRKPRIDWNIVNAELLAMEREGEDEYGEEDFIGHRF